MKSTSIKIYIGVIYQINQRSSSLVEICNMDRAIQEMVSFDELLCVLTFGGVLTVFRRDKNSSEGKGLQLVNTVMRMASYFFDLTHICFV